MFTPLMFCSKLSQWVFTIYRGVMPYISIQFAVLLLFALWASLAIC